jgi:hypothetical protein
MLTVNLYRTTREVYTTVVQCRSNAVTPLWEPLILQTGLHPHQRLNGDEHMRDVVEICRGCWRWNDEGDAKVSSLCSASEDVPWIPVQERHNYLAAVVTIHGSERGTHPFASNRVATPHTSELLPVLIMATFPMHNTNWRQRYLFLCKLCRIQYHISLREKHALNTSVWLYNVLRGPRWS